ncbi:MAG: HlyC/CorC family transporter [Chloroflexi bacterium]|nr:HlyC/CorC family transporter [Chloroflexota bacterium]MBI4505023.1 HlyC/CorC family transporter [Chloroflexota bacterium]
MEPPSWAEWLELGLALLVCAFAATAETALTALNRTRMQRLRDEGLTRAQIVETLLDRPNTLAATIEVLNVAGIIATVALLARIVPSYVPSAWALPLTSVLALVLVIFVGQLVPRTLAAQHPDAVALWVAPVLRLLEPVFSPIVRGSTAAALAAFRRLGLARGGEAPLVTEDELRTYITVGEEEGILEEDERAMIDGVLELEETVAREIMIPRVDVVAVEAQTRVTEALDLALERGKTRLPVFEDSLDNVVGVAHVRDLMRAYRQGEGDRLAAQYARPAVFVPDSKRVDDLLHEMQEQRIPMAIVVDEYGGTAGLLTIEDLVEEIVGEISDEHEEAKIQRLDDNEAIVDAAVSLDDVRRELDLAVEADDYDSVGGLVYHHLGKMPQPGDEVSIPGARISVLTTAGHRIRKVRILKEPTAAQA